MWITEENLEQEYKKKNTMKYINGCVVK